MSGNKSWPVVGLVFLLAAAACWDKPAELSEQARSWPRRVLITNDDGIESPVTLELARAFAQVAETFLVVPAQDQSSSTNFATSVRTGRFHVARRDVGSGVTAWAVDGYPADCVFFALAGPLRESRPDLVISGVNTGTNLADAWIGSGTIGAARMAAYYGVPAIAISGVDNEDPQAVGAVVTWVVRLARSEAVRRLQPPEYLTVSLPVGPASQIRGIEITQRARGLRDMKALWLAEDSATAGWQGWSLAVVRDAFPAPENTDATVVGGGKIAIVAMRVDEADLDMHRWLRKHKDLIPAW